MHNEHILSAMKKFTTGLIVAVFVSIEALGAQLAAQELLTEAPSRIRIFGVVRDEDGGEVAGAKITLSFTITADSRDQIEYWWKKPKVLATATAADGSYSIDVPFDHPGIKYRSILIVDAADCNYLVKYVDLDRMLVDLPFDLNLQPKTRSRIQILDSQAGPSRESQVFPASVSGVLLPRQLFIFPAFETDEAGWVDMPRFDNSDISSVYVATSDGKKQKIKVEGANGELLGQLVATGSASGKVKFPKGVDLKDWSGRSLWLFSGQFNNEDGKTWQQTKLDENGRFSVDHLGYERFQVRLEGLKESDLVMESWFPANEESDKSRNFVVPLAFAKRYTLSFLDDDGNSISTEELGFGLSPGVRNKSKLELKFPIDQKPTHSIFLFDPLKRHRVNDINLGRLEFDESGTAKPISLSRSRSLRGVVIDEQGTRVAGAELSATFSAEDWTQIQKTTSDSSGNFEVRGLPRGVTVELRGRKSDLETGEFDTLKVKSGTPANLVLKLIKPRTARPIGQIVDQHSVPVANARIVLLRGVVSQKESFGSARMRSQAIDFDTNEFTTDAEGRFMLPAITRLNDKFQLKVSAEGYFPITTEFVSGSRRIDDQGQLELGKFELVKRPVKRTVTVLCKNKATSRMIPNAKLVFVGLRSGKQLAASDSNGKATVELFDSSQVAGVAAKGFRTKIVSLKSLPKSELILELTKQEPEEVPIRSVFQSRTPEDYLLPASRLFSQLKKTNLSKATFYRKSLFYKSASLVNATDFFAMLDSEKDLEFRDYFLIGQVIETFEQAPELTLQRIQASTQSVAQKANLFSFIALNSSESHWKDEFYGEAIMEIESLSEKDRLLAAGAVSRCLLLDGRGDTARALIRRAWESSPEIKTWLAEQKTKQLVAESRVFGPMLGIIDPAAAFKLIRLFARQGEVDSLIDEAVCFIALAGKGDISQLCETHGIKFSGSGLYAMMRHANPLSNNQRLADTLERLLPLTEPSMYKVQAALYIAKLSDDERKRNRFVQVAVDVWRNAKIPFPWSYPTKLASEQLAQFSRLSEKQLNDLIFACLERAPAQFDSMQKIQGFANIGRMLSLKDPELSRVLLEPVLHFGTLVSVSQGSGFSGFQENLVCSAAVWMDPQWTEKYLVELSQKYSPDDPVRELQMYTTFIGEATRLASILRRSKKQPQ